MDEISFGNTAIVSCGTLSMELIYLKEAGFLDTNHLMFNNTRSSRGTPRELERQLIQRINQAKEKADKVLVVYGGKFCYVNADEPMRTMKKIIEEQGPRVARIQATHCMDMLASEAEREKIAQEVAGGEKVWWMTPGWIKFRHQVFKGWGPGDWPTKTSPSTRAGRLSWMLSDMWISTWRKKPEEFLEYSDWMGIPIQGYPITLDRFKSMLLEESNKLEGQ